MSIKERWEGKRECLYGTESRLGSRIMKQVKSTIRLDRYCSYLFPSRNLFSLALSNSRTPFGLTCIYNYERDKNKLSNCDTSPEINHNLL